jgi:hypothetical protein
MGVREAIRVVFPRTNVDFGRLAHQVVVVDAFRALACSDVGQHLGESAVASGVDEGCALGMVFGSADGDGGGIAVGVVVEGTVRYAAVCDVRSHFRSSVVPAAGMVAWYFPR